MQKQRKIKTEPRIEPQHRHFVTVCLQENTENILEVVVMLEDNITTGSTLINSKLRPVRWQKKLSSHQHMNVSPGHIYVRSKGFLAGGRGYFQGGLVFGWRECCAELA